MSFKEEIASRLRQFADDNKWSPAEFARQLKITPQQMNAYLQGTRTPGNKMRAKLENLKPACNIAWLLTGMYPDAENTRKEIEREEEERKLLQYLKSIGIDSVEKAKTVLSPEAIAEDVALVVAEKIKKLKRRKK